MRSIILLASLLAVPACSDAPAIALLEGKRWGNAAQPCSENYVTFDGELIAAHPKRREILPLWKIESIDQSKTDQSQLSLQVEPIESVLEGAVQSGNYRPGMVFHLEVEEQTVRIKSVSLGERTLPVLPGETLSMFNMTECNAPADR